MKRSTLFGFLFIIAISLCLFSSTVFSGEGDGKGEIHPWDVDGFGGDTVIGGIHILDKANSDGGSNSLSLMTVSLSSKFTIWLYNSEIITKYVSRVEVQKNKRSNTRGKLLNNF